MQLQMNVIRCPENHISHKQKVIFDHFIHYHNVPIGRQCMHEHSKKNRVHGLIRLCSLIKNLGLKK